MASDAPRYAIADLPAGHAKLRTLDLFSGIGGFALGLEATGGFETVAFCECEPFPRAILAQHWPEVPIYDDVRTLTADTLRRDGIAVDVICGGFPCQDLSFAGKRAGLEGARSGLWAEYARLVRELRPRFVIVENVPGLLSPVRKRVHGRLVEQPAPVGVVLGDLAALGYDATWDCVPASAVGAPHRRDRVWIVACADREGEHDGAVDAEMGRASQSVADAMCGRSGEERRELSDEGRTSQIGERRRSWAEPCNGREALADADVLAGRQGRARHAAQEPRGRHTDRGGERSQLCDANVSGLAFGQSQSRDVGEKLAPPFRADWWTVEPDVGRVAHGISARVDRLRALGNAVVPKIPHMIGRAILESIR